MHSQYIIIIDKDSYNMKNNYSKRLIDVIEYSREEAARLQNSYIGPEHLMLGIIRDGDGKAMQLLHDLHADVFDIKKRSGGIPYVKRNLLLHRPRHPYNHH